MAGYGGYELPNYSAIAPVVPLVYAPPPPSPPPPSLPSDVYSTPPLPSNANYNPPPLPLPLTLPPSISYQPPPEATPPPLASPPPPPLASPPSPIADSPPPVSSPPPPAVSSEPPDVEYTPDSSSSPPPSPSYLSPPPPSAPPPSPIMSPPPPLAEPPLVSPPLPSTPQSLPPAEPLPPIIYSSPPPPLATNPPTSSSPPPPPPVPDPPSDLAPPPPPPVEPPISSYLSPPPPPPSTAKPPAPAVSPPPIAEPPKSPPPPPVQLSPSGSQFPPSDAVPLPTLPSRPSPSTPNASRHPSLPLPTRPLVPVAQSNSSKGITTQNVTTIAVIAGMFMLAFVGLAVFVRKRRRPASSGGHAGGFRSPGIGHPQPSESSYPRTRSVPLVRYSSGSHGVAYSSPEPGLGHSQLWFTYEELSAITNGFSMQYLLGEGGFGCVFKGCLKDGRHVAVKQLKVGGSQGEREFKAEVEIISRVHHRHLVSLVGYCISERERLLVYDYVPNNTLYHHLHVKREPVMSWTTRVKVASGAARGIAYLHEDCHPRIIHRDIKSSNILLNNNFEAQVSDFGLARLAMEACTHVSTRVMGTFGYLAPEYASSGKLTAKSDIYSFGVILLELVTGRKPVDDSQPPGDESLVEWARPLLSNALENGNSGDLPDPRLEKNYNESEMFRMIEAAAACIRHSAARRPRMVQVVRALDSLRDLDINNGVKPGESELFSEPQTEEIERFQRRGFGSQGYSSDVS